MKRELTDEQLVYLGRELSSMYLSAVRAWEAGMKAFPVNSRQYRSICTAGKKIRDAYFLIMGEAEARGWRGDKLKEVFNVGVYCGFG